MRSPRPLISGRDYQIRYALWRLLALADGRDETSGQVERIRAEWPVAVPGGQPVYADVLLEGQGGVPLELIECKEHGAFLASASVVSFLEAVAGLARGPLAQTHTRFRFVSTARFLRNTVSGRAWDFAAGGERQDALAQIAPAVLDRIGSHRERIIWDVGHLSKKDLTARCLFHCSRPSVPDNRELYLRLYTLLTAQMSRREPSGSRGAGPFPEDLLLYLYGMVKADPRLGPIGTPAPDGIAVKDVQRLLPAPAAERRRVARVSHERIAGALRRGVLGEDRVSLEELYVPQTARLEAPDATRGMSDLRFGEATELLFKWLADAQASRGGDSPLLVIGDFGVGKSSLLTWFAHRLAERGEKVVPLLLPLRDLKAAGRTRSLDDVIQGYVARQWGADLTDAAPDGERYCLLCDGFDELNLYYQGPDFEEWIAECFRSLLVLAERPDLFVVVSSRPILLMDVRRPNFQGAHCPKLELQVFDDPQVEQWCANYRRAMGVDRSFNVAFLEDRDLLDVARVPIVLYMIARVFESDAEAFRSKRRHTRAEIYRLFVDWTCKGGYHRDGVKHRVPRNYRLLLRDMAWHLFQSLSGYLEEDALLAMLRADHGDLTPDRVPVDRHVLVAHMLRPKATEDDASDAHLIEFTHQSFREYLVAERVWAALGPARSSGELDPVVWAGLAGKPFTAAKVELLGDMVRQMGAADALRLYRALRDTDRVGAYASRWLSPHWQRLREHPDTQAIQAAEHYVMGTDTRACYMATLGFILRVQCHERLRELARLGEHDEVPAPPSALHFDWLLHLQRTLPEQCGSAIGGREVLLQHLDGLCLEPKSRLLGHSIERAVLRRAVLREVYFTGSEWHAVDVCDADLSGAVFERCFLWLTLAWNARLVGANFTDAILAHERDSELEGGDFSGANFTRAQFRGLAVSKATFIGNTWTDARVLSPAPELEPYLAECTLDEQAAAFFRRQQVALRDCTIRNA